MAGRILPVALAAFAGVAIGVSTFGEEFKEQRRQRLQREYNRDVAAASALPSDGPSPMASSSIPAPQPEQLPTQPEPTKPSKISSMLGLWAWSSKEDPSKAAKVQPPIKTNDISKQQP